MSPAERQIIKSMHHADGTNWTPRAVAEMVDVTRDYACHAMRTLERIGALERVTRGLYRVPR